MRKHLTYNIKQLSETYAKGIISPCSVAESALEDADKLNNLNAFTRLTPEVALLHAQNSTNRYAEKQAKGPLDGVTIAIKDNFCTKGLHTTCASKMLQDFKPHYNATVCERLFKAGTVLIGKTNMDEFGMGSATLDSIYGPTKNIWSESFNNNNWRIVGGSSGGSAAAVAGGICYAALGSDTGGSIRNPASYCGVVGFKPSYGLISRYGLIPLANSMDCPGIFARCVSDCVDILNVIAGPDERDSTTFKQAYRPIPLPSPDIMDIRKIRIGIPREFHCEGVSQDVLESWQKVADLLCNEGAQVRLVSLPHTAASILAYTILNHGEVASNMAKYDGIQYGHRASDAVSTEALYTKSRNESLNNVVKLRILSGNYFLIKNSYEQFYEKALRIRRLIVEDYKKIFESASEEDNVDVLLTPTTLSAALTHKEYTSCFSEEQCAIQDWCTTPANVAGIPAISIPINMNGQGLPISLQLMSNSLNDELLLSVAQWIEAHINFNSYCNKYFDDVR